MTQVTFGSNMGVSKKTVESWKSGHNHPDGAGRRLLSIMKTDPFFPCRSGIIKEYKRS